MLQWKANEEVELKAGHTGFREWEWVADDIIDLVVHGIYIGQRAVREQCNIEVWKYAVRTAVN